MAEENVSNSGTQTPKIKSAGPVQTATLSSLAGTSGDQGGGQAGDQGGGQAGDSGAQGGQAGGADSSVAGTEGGQVINKNNNGDGHSKSGDGSDVSAPALTREQIKQMFNFDGTPEEFKSHIEKLSQKETKTEPTPEEKEKQEKLFEQRVLQTYLDNGGKVEDYVALKTIVSSDLKEFSVAELRRELKENKFNDEQINEIISERYYQLSDEDIDALSDEDQKAYAKAKREYGSKKLAGHSSYIKEQAEKTLQSLRDAVAAQDLLANKEAEFSSKVDETLSKLPRKISFELGELEGVKIPSVEFDVQEEAVKKISEVLKDPAKRQQFFYNEDNTFKVDAVANLMLRNEILEAAIKSSYLTGATREVEKLKKIFPHNPADLGVGGRTNQGQKGKMVSIGQPTVARPTQK